MSAQSIGQEESPPRLSSRPRLETKRKTMTKKKSRRREGGDIGDLLKDADGMVELCNWQLRLARELRRKVRELSKAELPAPPRRRGKRT